jgi:hypothetical protein
MIGVWNAPKNRTHLSALAYPRRREAPALGKNGLLAGFFCHPSNFDKGLQIEKEFFFLTDDAGMLLKTKHRCGKLGGEAGIPMKTQVVSPQRRECY